MPSKAELEERVRVQASRITALKTERNKLISDNRQTHSLLQEEEKARAKLEKEVEKLQADHALLEKQYQVLASEEKDNRITRQLLAVKSRALKQAIKAVGALQKAVSAVAALDQDNF